MSNRVFKVCDNCKRLNSYESEYVVHGPNITIAGRSYMPGYLSEEANKKTVSCMCGETLSFKQQAD